MRTTCTGLTEYEAYHVLEHLVKKGEAIKEISRAFTPRQLSHFIDEYIAKLNPTATIERSISKSLCCFLFELHQKGESHYSDIRTIVFNKYEHMTNDYSTLKYFGLIEKSAQGKGFWKITDRGISFLQGTFFIPEKLKIKSSRVIESSSKLVRIHDFPNFNHVAYNPPATDNLIV